MAMGEWLSVNSARELAQQQIAVEADELREFPEEEKQELVLIYQAKGLPRAAGEGARRAHHRRQGHRARHADARGARHRSRGARRLGLGRRRRRRSCCSRWARSFRWRRSSFLPGPPPSSRASPSAPLVMFAIGAGTTLFTGRGALFSGAAPARDRHRRRRRHLRPRQADRRLDQRLSGQRSIASARRRNCARRRWRRSAPGSIRRTRTGAATAARPRRSPRR